MYAKVRMIKRGQIAGDGTSTRNSVVDDMMKNVGRIIEFRIAIFKDWYNNVPNDGPLVYYYHKSWLNFAPCLTYICPKCNTKARLKINLYKVKSLHDVPVKDRACICGVHYSHVDVVKRILK